MLILSGLMNAAAAFVRSSKGAEEAEIFFRVRQIFKNSAILVMDGDNQLAKFKREHLAPGEMEKIKIPNALMKRIVSDKLTVSVEEA